MGSDVGQIFPTASLHHLVLPRVAIVRYDETFDGEDGLHRDLSISYALVCEKRQSSFLNDFLCSLCVISLSMFVS